MLALSGFDSVKRQPFHRALGGGIEAGETAEAALRREFHEELAVSLDAVAHLGTVESRFVHEGQPSHEVAEIYLVESAEIDQMPSDVRLVVLDEGSPVGWVRTDVLDRPFYPDGALELLVRRTRSGAAT